MSEEQRLRDDALGAFRSALAKIDPCGAVAQGVRLHEKGDRLLVLEEEIELDGSDRVYVIAIGKAAPRMVAGLEETLGGRIDSGVVLSNAFPDVLPAKYRTFECTHPLPSPQNVEASGRALELARGAGEEDLVICLISGGGSAIFARPVDGLTLEDKRETVRVLLLAGAPIDALNAVRKHLSAVKGGQLLRAISPAAALGLYISDVPGDDLATIASGPTVPDPTTFADAWSAIERLELEEKLPVAVAEHLRRGAEGLIPETPKPGGQEYNVCNRVICANRDMLSALEAELRGRGYWTMTELDPFEGEARDRGRALARRAIELARSLPASARPYAFISGGETTVKVRGDGLGGRNSELALAAAMELEGVKNCVVLAAGTDGIDGPTDAAGALADGFAVERARARGLDPGQFLEENDSYNFFKPLGDLIVTGPTGTNVMDIALALIGREDA